MVAVRGARRGSVAGVSLKPVNPAFAASSAGTVLECPSVFDRKAAKYILADRWACARRSAECSTQDDTARGNGEKSPSTCLGCEIPADAPCVHHSHVQQQLVLGRACTDTAEPGCCRLADQAS
jgi:hypothetical protein